MPESARVAPGGTKSVIVDPDAALARATREGGRRGDVATHSVQVAASVAAVALAAKMAAAVRTAGGVATQAKTAEDSEIQGLDCDKWQSLGGSCSACR